MRCENKKNKCTNFHLVYYIKATESTLCNSSRKNNKCQTTDLFNGFSAKGCFICIYECISSLKILRLIYFLFQRKKITVLSEINRSSQNNLSLCANADNISLNILFHFFILFILYYIIKTYNYLIYYYLIILVKKIIFWQNIKDFLFCNNSY